MLESTKICNTCNQSFATGGVVGKGVNEEGVEIITLPDGFQVFPNDIARQIANSVAVSKGGTEIHVSFAGVNISNNLA
jgi:hypothetical protein